MIERLNSSTNLIAFALVLTAVGFVALKRADIASNLVSGALGVISGSRMAQKNDPTQISGGTK